MAVIIDRRIGQHGKSLKNRQRFLDRAKGQIKKAIRETIENKDIKDIGKSQKEIGVTAKDISEPTFSKDRETGVHDNVLPGNDRFSAGDTSPKPFKKKGGSGNGEGAGGPSDSLDEFQFTLTREEFLNYLFEDLELPYFIKESLMTARKSKPARAGFTNSGSPANLNTERTYKKSIGRRLALRRPTDDEVAEAERRWMEAVEENLPTKELDELYEEWKRLEGRQKVVPFIDEKDLKYNLWTKKPKPESQAVMFCLMDVSGSMGEVEKDISKRFFLILYLFLERKYDRVDIRFIRHTTEAEEVDEQTFFYDRQSGGTAISSGLTCIRDVIKAEYDPEDWNIYIAQCTDGDNFLEDNQICSDLLENELLPITQYYSYIEVSQYDRGGYSLGYNAWPVFYELSQKYKNLACRKCRSRNKVYQVFVDLFKRLGR